MFQTPSRLLRPVCALVAAGLLAGSLAGCEPYTGIAMATIAAEANRDAPTDLDVRTRNTVDQMLANRPDLLETGAVAVVGSISDIRDVNQSTPFGNIIADLIRTRLVQHGLAVTDMRLRSTVWLDKYQGEIVLSRDRRAVMPAPVTSEIVTGVYAVASGSVIVSLKIMAANDARIMSAGDFMVPRTADVDRLLLSTVASSH